MKTKILIIAIGLLFPIIAIGQISVDYSFKNGAVEIEVTNNTTDLVSIVNELNIYDDGSAIDVKFLDENEEFNTTYINVGDKISISKKINK